MIFLIRLSMFLTYNKDLAIFYFSLTFLLEINRSLNTENRQGEEFLLEAISHEIFCLGI